MVGLNCVDGWSEKGKKIGGFGGGGESGGEKKN